jgi:L-fuculose-phosphate aldolase
VVSARLDGDNFLITPTGMDRRSLEIEDIVLICDGQRERDKVPSRSVRLHRAIYRSHPGLGSIITAQSPNIMAYAITDMPFDTRTIPESYIMLRRIPVIPYGTQYTSPDEVAKTVSEQVPVALIQNDCVLTVGRDVLHAFDRLEVAEYSAHSLNSAGSIGPLVPIGAREIADLETYFPSI